VNTIQITVPASKSISNRLLILQKTCSDAINYVFTIKNLSTAEDTKLLNNLLNDISKSTPCTSVPPQCLSVKQKEKITQSCTKKTSKTTEIILNCENCGTAYRFLTAYLSCTQGKWILDGSKRMRNRPIKPLVDTLIRAGADILYLCEEGFPPLQIIGKQLNATHFEIDAQQSSQYVSAVAMILPLMRQDCEIVFSANGNSLQYIDMTVKLMQQLGLNISRVVNRITYTPPQPPKKGRGCPPPLEVLGEVEYDWSSAAVWFAFAALLPNAVFFIQGLKKSELQADSIIAEWCKLFGIQTNYTENEVQITNTGNKPNIKIISLDCRNNPDLVPYLVSLCVGLKQKAVLENVQNLTIKESNRIEALIQELGKIACLNYKNNALIIEPNKKEFPNKICFSSHNDHRIAMCLSVLSTCIQDVKIDNIKCVEKSYPNFWGNFAKISL
jgi:3-phosphoshikimate 1-carboxyvinyltransferase